MCVFTLFLTLLLMYTSFPRAVVGGNFGQVWFELFFTCLLSAQLETMIQGSPHDQHRTVVQNV